MRELAKEYKRSLGLLNNRTMELTKQREFLSARVLDPEKDSRIIELNDRLKPLKEMQRELREVTKEVEHYYDRGHWRSEKYTFNQRKSQQFIYAGPSRR